MGLNRAGRAVATASLLPLALAACGTGTGSADAPSTSPSATTSYAESPLAPYLPLSAISVDEQRTISAEAETLIAACMKEQGFAYDQPYVPDEPILPPLDGLTPLQWAELYGYGVTTLDAGDATTPEPEQRSGAEQAAYDAALYGAGTGDESAYDWQQEGCMGAAYHEATGGADEVMRDPRFADLFAAVAAVQQDAATSEPMTALDAEWSSCLADAGHPGIASPADAAASIRMEWFAAGGEEASAEVRTDLRAEEIALATADASCQQTVEYRTRAEQVLWAAEAVLVAERQDELDALVAED
jgi:hypothetical protein